MKFTGHLFNCMEQSLEAHNCSADHSPAMDSDGSFCILNIFCQDLY